jgi:hypothetical protein
MKQLILGLIAALGLCFAAGAESDTEARQVIHDIQVGEDNVNRIENLLVGTSVNLPNGSIPLVDLTGPITLLNTTNTTTATSAFTAAAVGQLLFGFEGGSQRVWRATALTSTNWTKILILP